MRTEKAGANNELRVTNYELRVTNYEWTRNPSLPSQLLKLNIHHLEFLPALKIEVPPF